VLGVVVGEEVGQEVEGKAEQKITRETTRFAMSVEQAGACSRRLKPLIELCVDLLR
jgi:hypothetical protein